MYVILYTILVNNDKNLNKNQILFHFITYSEGRTPSKWSNKGCMESAEINQSV